MDYLPIEFSNEAHAWANLVCSEIGARIGEAEIDASNSVVGDRGDAASEHSSESEFALRRTDTSKTFWIEPEDPRWGILLTAMLADDENFRSREALEKAASKPVVEPLIQSIVALFRQFINQLDTTAEREEHDHLCVLLMVQQAARLYERIHGVGLRRCEGALLQIMVYSKQPIGLRLAVDLLLQKPPKEWIDSSMALSPLMQFHHWEISDVFPSLLSSENPSVLAPALDVANHATRTRNLSEHPGKAKYDSLVKLLGGITNQLAMMEDDPSKFGGSVASIQRILFDSVSLCVSLCDAMGLIGNEDAKAKLNQALKLGHRRIQTEASFALAKLGDSRAVETLVALAADPACRLRAIAYAAELGAEDRVDQKWTSSLAKAEAELVNWLSQHEQMGLAPHRVELIEQRTLYWPGYESPQECFLFRFEYEMGTFRYSNLGIAGPMVHAFAEDMANTSVDNALAIFAAWDVDHPDAYEVPMHQLDPNQRALVKQWEEELGDKGYQVIQSEYLGVFFEHKAILVRCHRDNNDQMIVYDGENVIASTVVGRASPQVYLQWKGRIVMETLNPELEFDEPA